MKPIYTIIVEKEDEMFVALCPELDIASQGESIEEAKANLKEAIELFFEYANEAEIEKRLNREYYISTLEVDVA